MQNISALKSLSRNILPAAGLLILAVLLAGCTASPASAPAVSPGVTNGAIIKDPLAYEGRNLVLKGTIAVECSSGCWFLLDDGTGTLYVDLAKNNFAIPQLQGSTVVVKGLIHVDNGDPKLYATNVTSDSRAYP